MSQPAVDSPQHRLLHAFMLAEYAVIVDGREGIVRVSRSHRWLDRALVGQPWAIVTACNPAGQRLPPADNTVRHRQLTDLARALGPCHPACNRDPAGDWPDEPGVLLARIRIEPVDALARRFEQAAVVTGRAGQPACLRLYGDGWPDALPACVESAN